MKSDTKKILREYTRNRSEDLDFLDTHWDKVKDISYDITSNLPKMSSEKRKQHSPLLSTTNYSDMTNWDVSELFGVSKTLNALAHKISHMVSEGRSDAIKRMLQSIANNNFKTLYRGLKQQDINFPNQKRESLGKGHFRWDYQTYTLTPKEIDHLKRFFSL